MQIKYRIVEVQPADQLIVVRFWSDITPETELASEVDAEGNMVRCRTDMAISLPTPTPTGAALDALIMGHCPVGFFKMKERVANAEVDTSLSALLPLVGAEVALPPPQETPATVIPQVVTMGQAQLALFDKGYLSAVETALASMPGTEGDRARLEWKTRQSVERASPLVATMGTILGLTSAQLDELFIYAKTL